MLSPWVRAYMLYSHHSTWGVVSDIARNTTVGQDILPLCNITITLQYGDWFLLVQIAKNIDQETFTEFLTALRQRVRTTLPRYVILKVS